jgi:predicted HicB family RNase H-like nuclease
MSPPRQPNAKDFGQLKLRVKNDLRKRLEREAEKNHRTLNAEITVRLERSLGAPNK